MSEWVSGWKADAPAREDCATVRVRYAETDAMGWVYYANYFHYFEVARAELMRRAWKSYRELEDEGVMLPVVESHCRYVRGARYDDELRIRTRLTIPSGARLRFDYRVLRGQDQELLAEGYTVHCFVSPDGKPRPVPRELRNVVAL
jgi:acyl-CoA thioester hydrolase